VKWSRLAVPRTGALLISIRQNITSFEHNVQLSLRIMRVSWFSSGVWMNERLANCDSSHQSCLGASLLEKRERERERERLCVRVREEKIYSLAGSLSLPRNPIGRNKRVSREFDLGVLSPRALRLPRNGPDRSRRFYSINWRRRGARDPTATSMS